MIGPVMLGGAQGRLLPASIPFRFFIFAAITHIVFWLMLFAAADDIPDFSGGLGMVLSAIHALTLGVFVMVVIGASMQLLLVATRRPMMATWPCHLISILMFIGVPVLLWGMAIAHHYMMMAGGFAISAGFLVYIVLIGENLIRAKGMSVVIHHGLGALLGLGVLSVLGMTLMADYEHGFFINHSTVAVLHATVAIFGFMGLLAFGFSFILVPMFALASDTSGKKGFAILWGTIAAIIITATSLLRDWVPGLQLAFLIGLGVAVLYGWIMRGFLRTGMKKQLGLSFVLIKASWGILIVGLALGLMIASGLKISWALFGFVILVGWLLTFLLGIMQRIVPFLASMHSSVNGGRPLLVSRLTPDLPTKIHAACHFSALAAVTIGIALEQVLLIQIGAAIGAVGATTFAYFVIEVTRRLIAHHRAGNA